MRLCSLPSSIPSPFISHDQEARSSTHPLLLVHQVEIHARKSKGSHHSRFLGDEDHSVIISWLGWAWQTFKKTKVNRAVGCCCLV